MISSQLGTEARPPRLRAVRRGGGSGASSSSSSGSSSGSGSGVTCAAGASASGVGSGSASSAAASAAASAWGSSSTGRASRKASMGCSATGSGSLTELDGVVAQREPRGSVVGAHGGQPALAGVREVVAGRGGCLDDVADQPVRVVVLGNDVVARHVEGEVPGPAAARGRVGRGEHPAAVVAAPGVPLDGVGGHADPAQVALHGVAQGARGAAALAVAAAYRGALGTLRDVLTLGEHRAGERHDPLHRGVRGLRH